MKNLLKILVPVLGLSLGSLKSYSQKESIEYLQILKNFVESRSNEYIDPSGNPVYSYSISDISKKVENGSKITEFSISLYKYPKDSDIFIVSKKDYKLSVTDDENVNTGEQSIKIYPIFSAEQIFIDSKADGLKSKEDKYGFVEQEKQKTDALKSFSKFTLEQQQKIKENYENILKETHNNIKRKLLEE